jgi:hypothetical protein
MSNDFRTFPAITVSMVFDGRLERFNIREGNPDGHTQLDFEGNPLSPANLEAKRRSAMANDMNYDWEILDHKPLARSLTDGSNVVRVCPDDAGYVDNLILVGPDETDILNAIEEACDCRIVSEDDPQFWGYDSWEQCFAERANAPRTYEHRNEFFAELWNFLHDKPHRFKPGTRGMAMAERARLHIEAKPELIEPGNCATLLELIF